MTRTYATLAVTPTTHAEILSKFKAAGYDHAIEDGVIDMHGVALVVEDVPAERSERRDR